MKNYIVFVNDHSGSMESIAQAALKDYNRNIEAIVSAANKEKLDTVVSVISIGRRAIGGGNCVERDVVISNPHVLAPKTSWAAEWGTPLYDGIGDAIDLLQELPDSDREDVSFLIMVTTDGEEQHSSIYNRASITQKIAKIKKDDRWTITCRVPKGKSSKMEAIGIYRGNIQEWETTAQGMTETTELHTQAVNNYFVGRTVGAKSSKSFFSDVSSVDVKALTDISQEVSLYVVPDTEKYTRTEIQDFILEHRQQYLKGAAFYQLVKTEARVGHKKLVVVRDRNTGKFYSGKDARKMLKLPDNANVRVNPGDHGDYDIFIQSESTNRLLPRGTGVVYWEKVGIPFTEEDLNRYTPKTNSKGVVELPQVQGRTKPIPSPVPVQHKPKFVVNGMEVFVFSNRKDMREYARANKRQQRDAVDFGLSKTEWPSGCRWFVFK